MDRKLWEMKLHDEIIIGDNTVLRVPGGWIYTINRYHNGIALINSVFVPYISDNYQSII